MDTQKIGEFLKQNRKNKNLTQAQLAEILGVSGRTISRWETGTNMPDLSILIQLADYYDVEVKDILDGGKKGETMNKELKETLTKVADYSEYEKKKAISAGCTAFGVMFTVCAVMIIIQMVIATELTLVLGETITLILGGIMYCLIMVYNGIWESNSKYKSTLWHDIIISVTCAGTFSLLYSLCLVKLNANESQVVYLSLLFFIGIAVLGFIVLRLLVLFSRKRKKAISDEPHL